MPIRFPEMDFWDNPRTNVDPDDRTCLKCGKLFPSISKANRICQKCTHANKGIRPSFRNRHSTEG